MKDMIENIIKMLDIYGCPEEEYGKILAGYEGDERNKRMLMLEIEWCEKYIKSDTELERVDPQEIREMYELAVALAEEV